MCVCVCVYTCVSILIHQPIWVQTALTTLMCKVAIFIAYSLMFAFHSVGASKGHESHQDHSLSIPILQYCREEVWGETVPGKLLQSNNPPLLGHR